MTSRVLALLTVLCLVGVPALARAEEAPAPAPAPAPEPAPAPAPAEETYVEHSSYDMALAESGLPQGWAMGEGDAAAKDENALKDAVLGLAKAAGVSEDGVQGVVTRSATAPEGRAVFLLLDLEKAHDGFATSLRAAAKEKGWEVRTMAAPTRLLVLSAPAAVRAAAVEAQVRFAARMLATKAWTAIEYRNGARAVVLAKAALAMDGKSAGANLVLGMAAAEEAQVARDPKGFAPAVERLRAATAADASAPLTGSQSATAWGMLGGSLLLLTGHDAEARDALKKAVAAGADVERAADLGHRYNLACAHGRLGELDAAFAALGAVLAEHAKNPIRGIDHWREDPDFANLKADPRWAKLLETHGAAAAPKGD